MVPFRQLFFKLKWFFRDTGEQGQSVVEFIFILPLLVGLCSLLIHVNSAIQVSIVNQQYARGWAIYLAMNSPYFPVWEEKESFLLAGGANANQVVLGVSDTVLKGSKGTPVASVQQVARSARQAPANKPQNEDDREMAWVRARNSVTLCTAPLSGTGFGPSGHSIQFSENSDFGAICSPGRIPYE